MCITYTLDCEQQALLFSYTLCIAAGESMRFLLAVPHIPIFFSSCNLHRGIEFFLRYLIAYRVKNYSTQSIYTLSMQVNKHRSCISERIWENNLYSHAFFTFSWFLMIFASKKKNVPFRLLYALIIPPPSKLSHRENWQKCIDQSQLLGGGAFTRVARQKHAGAIKAPFANKGLL